MDESNKDRTEETLWNLDNEKNGEEEKELDLKAPAADSPRSGNITVVDKRFWAKSDEEKAEGRERREAPSYVQQLKDKLSASENKLNEYIKSYRKSKEETEKFRSRINRDFQGRLENAKAGFLYNLLEVLDNFERAMEAADKTGDFESYHEGVQMIYHQLMGKLNEEGVKPIETEGKPFDPGNAEAVDIEEVEDESRHNVVLEELSKGYRFKDTVLRPARVKVGKTPRTEESADEENSANKSTGGDENTGKDEAEE